MTDVPQHSPRGHQFGTFKGVFVPSILTILGVVLFLRLGWVVGNVGLTATLMIVTLSSLITFVTGLSISATATNMRVGGGGAYYLISRNFGVEAGAAVGLPLYLAQGLGVSFYIAGFAESLHALIPFLSTDVIAFGSLIVIFVLSYTSADLAMKAQFVIFSLILLSLLSFFLGSPTAQPAALTATNPVSFWVAFAVFFPAVTGIEAGVAMSGDLKDPSRSLPLGTLAAILIGYLVYLAVPIFLAQFASLETLRTNTMIMKEVAMVPGLIFLGIWGASLSSALGALLGGPRTLQAMSHDRILPQFLGRGFGQANEPRIATAVTFLVAAGGLMLGGLDVIAPVLSMFFLTSYGALNLIAGFESLISNPSWRPKLKVPWLISLVGAFLCIGAMLMINPGASFVALALVILIFIIMQKREMNVRFRDMRQSLMLYFARMSIYKLAEDYDMRNARAWRPNMLVMSGSPMSRWYLIELADAITHGKGFLTVASLLFAKPQSGKLQDFERSVKEFLAKRNVPALVKVKYSDEFVAGVVNLLRDYGLGPLVPNTLMVGDTEKEENFEHYSLLIETVFRTKKNLLIVREDHRQKETNMPRHAHDRHIDVWWGRQQGNANLMLALGHMLQNSPEWMGSKLILKTLVTSEDERQGVSDNLIEFVRDARIDAAIDIVIQKPGDDSFATIRRESSDSDLVFIGLRPPNLETGEGGYSAYYDQLIERTKEYPLTIMTLAGEDIAFQEIFQ